ncbi:MAG: thiol:disulfide interchange protein DsbA/DsbL [Xanthomonadales bacterium]|nr:thiol:disulfide interchange protein DsbA/DsbL [Xanthomonadales bacterium]
MKYLPKAFVLIFLITVFNALAKDSVSRSEPALQAGIDYKIINPAWPTGSKKTVIYEFFSYMCPGCNAFEPHMEQLSDQTSEQHEIIRVPVSFYPQWEPHAKAYYALKMMGELDKVHKSLFAAIHQFKKPLRTLEDIGDWLFASFSIDKQAFLSTAESFAVDNEIRKANKMVKTLGIAGVPRLVVDGKYLPDFKQLKTADNIIEATLYLANK